MLLTSVTPEGRFRVGIHSPSFRVSNLRERDHLLALGSLPGGAPVDNRENFPASDINVSQARPIYEIVNSLPFRGCTFIDSGWATARAQHPESILIQGRSEVSLRQLLADHCSAEATGTIIANLPKPLRYELAARSTDPEELVFLATSSCRMVFAGDGRPLGLQYEEVDGRRRALIDDFELFETIANNPVLPDAFKEVMVLRPGVQGNSEIVGDFSRDTTEVFEYLRANSYIPWGHFAANMAHSCIRYRISDLSLTDMQGLRHLYYQRSFVALAGQLKVETGTGRRQFTVDELEKLRKSILAAVEAGRLPDHPATLWGWNFGYDFSGSGYRLHASHQMIHQQYAMVPEFVEETGGGRTEAFSSGDQVAEVVRCYRQEHGRDFFTDYLTAIDNNRRTDGTAGEDSLVVWKDNNVLLFVPKAQVSQWELQLMVIADSVTGPVGNIIEADIAVRNSLDLGILRAQQILAGLGATMVSTIEYGKRFGISNGQRLLYAFLPKLPWSMGAFSEAQGRFVLGHYPEDFAIACRRQLGCEEDTLKEK